MSLKFKNPKGDADLGKSQIETGELGREVDPVFTASPAGSITLNDVSNWNSKADGIHSHANFTGAVDYTEEGPPASSGASGFVPGPASGEQYYFLQGDGTWSPVVQDKTHTHYQGVSAASWTINHNLNKYPAVNVIDSANSNIMGSITYDSLNQITISFAGDTSGTATLN
jgi:hypothetical protein